MIETWVNIIETLICIHIIQKIKKIIPEKEEEKENKEQNEEIEEGIEEEKGESLLGKIKNYDYKGLLGSNEEKESMSKSYEILEHKYYEKMQQLVVKLKEEQSQLKYQLGSTQDAYEFELDINLEATQSKIPITHESLLSLNDIFTKTKRFMKGDKKTWKENVTEFINKHFMNDLVDDIVTNSHYNSSNVMSIIQDQIPQLRFLNETNMKENFFSTIVEQEGKQYDNETKTKFTKYYHHFFLENLNGNVKTTEGLKELENLLKEFQKLRDPEFYAKEILEKIDMTYEPNLNLMRDFVKGNMKTKFEAYVKPNIEIIEGVVELKTERVIELIKEVSNKLEEQKDNIIEDTEKINEQLVEIKKLQEIIENQKEDYSIQKENYNKQKEEDKDKYSKLKDAHKKEMDDELEKGSKEFQKKIEEIIQNHEGDKSEINSKLNEYLNNLETKKKELKEKEKENKILLENNEKQEQGINKFKNDIDVLNNKNKELDENSKRIETDMNDKITKLTEENIGLKNTIEMATEENEPLKKENDTKLAAIAKELEEEKDKSAVSLDEAVAKMTSNLLESENMNEELRKQLIDDLVKLKAESSSLRNEKKNISKKMEEYEKELKEYKKRIDNEFQKISVQNNQLQSDLEKDKQEIERLNSNNKNLQKKNEDLSVKQGRLESEIKRLNDEKTQYKTQLTSTQEELETYKRKNTELKKQIDFLKKQQEDLKNQYEEQNNMLNEDLKGKDITIDELRKQLEAKNKEIADNKAQIEAKNKEIAAKEAQIEYDLLTITKLQNIVSPLQEHITKLEELIAKLTSEKEQVEADLNSIRAKEEEEERIRLAEEERKRQEEEAQRQKEEAERLKKEEEEKERPKKEALEYINNFLDTIKKIKSQLIEITFTYFNSEGNENKYEIDRVKLGKSVIEEKKKEIKNRRNKIIKNDEDLNYYLNIIDNYIKVFSKFKKIIENEKINEDILVEHFNYTFENDKEQVLEYLRKDFQFPNLNSRTATNLSNYIKFASDKIKEICKNKRNTKKIEILLKETDISCDKLLNKIKDLEEIVNDKRFINLFDNTRKKIIQYIKKEMNNNSNSPIKNIVSETPDTVPYDDLTPIKQNTQSYKNVTPDALNFFDEKTPTKGGKKKTRRKGRTKKKTKTRKK